jgi:hypothetical protein
MKARNLIIGIAATSVAAGSFALPTVVSAHSTVSISLVAIKMVVPSTVTRAGAFKFEVLGTGTFKSFDIYRKESLTGNSFVKIASHRNGKTYIDTEMDGFNNTTYGMVPYSGLNGTGSKGAEAYSPTFSPYSYTEEQAYFGNSGTFQTDTSTKYFGTHALESTSAGADVVYYDSCDYNDGLIIGTGPSGGIGSVYVNGTFKGTINFYSATVTGFSVAFKYGTAVSECNTFDIVQTGTGAGGGVDMWFTGVTEARGTF